MKVIQTNLEAFGDFAEGVKCQLQQLLIIIAWERVQSFSNTKSEQ